MKIHKIILVYLLLEISICSTVYKWKLDIVNEERQSEIKLTQGKFTKIYFVLTNATELIFPFLEEDSFILTFDDENIISLDKEIILTPKENLVYSTFIGLKCDNSITEDTYKIKIEVTPYNEETLNDLIEYSPIEASIKKGEFNIDLNILFSSMPKNSFNLFQLSEEPYNVDEIKIKVSEIKGFNFNDIVIKSFIEREKLYDESSSNHGFIFSSIFGLNNEEELTDKNFTLNLILESEKLTKCYNIPDKFTFSIEKDIPNINKTKGKDDKKRPLSSIPQEPELSHNISRITIDDTGKHPKKEYVLNVRKTDVIQRKNKIRMVYNNDPNAKKTLTSDFNHNIKVIKNVSKDLPTVESLPVGAKIIHRYNFSFNPNIPNTSRVEIDETGKIPKKQVVVSPRKNDVIRQERKPLKINIDNYNSNQTVKKIPIPGKQSDKTSPTLRGRTATEQSKPTRGGKDTTSSTRTKTQGGTTSTTKTTETRTSRGGKDTTSSTRTKTQGGTTTTTKTTETRTTRGGKDTSKTQGGTTTTTKTTETRTSRGGGKDTSKTQGGTTTTTKTTETRTTRGGGKDTTSTTKTTKTTETRTTRGKSEGGKTRGSGGETKTTTTTTKTTETKSGKGGSQLKITRNTNESAKKDSKADKSSKKNKFEPVSTGALSVRDSGNKRNKSAGGNARTEEKTSKSSKVTVTKTTETSGARGSSGSGSSRVRKGNQSGITEETKVTKTKSGGGKTSITTTTTTTTTTKMQSTSGGDGGVTKVKKFRSQRMLKK